MWQRFPVYAQVFAKVLMPRLAEVLKQELGLVEGAA
jgi:hypothetical protein